MRDLARVGAVVSATIVGATYVLAKIDFFTRFDPAATGEYLAGHWGYWTTMLAFSALALLLSRARLHE